jgi:hypothetical protein
MGSQPTDRQPLQVITTPPAERGCSARVELRRRSHGPCMAGAVTDIRATTIEPQPEATGGTTQCQSRQDQRHRNEDALVGRWHLVARIAWHLLDMGTRHATRQSVATTSQPAPEPSPAVRLIGPSDPWSLLGTTPATAVASNRRNLTTPRSTP